MHFRLVEFACKCGHKDCNAPAMNGLFLNKLEAFRTEWGQPMSVTSGTRCKPHNQAVGGAANSMHLTGQAADFAVTPTQRYAFIALAIKHGFSGIGIAKTFIHLDTRPLSTGEFRRLWTY